MVWFLVSVWRFLLFFSSLTKANKFLTKEKLTNYKNKKNKDKIRSCIAIATNQSIVLKPFYLHV
jgi:hypothetical protein